MEGVRMTSYVFCVGLLPHSPLQFEFEETVQSRLRDTIETEGFHERLPDNWTFSDIDV
jgi:hypothetical protein